MANQKSINSPSIRDRVKVFMFEQESGITPPLTNLKIDSEGHVTFDPPKPVKPDKYLYAFFVDTLVEPLPGDSLYLGDGIGKLSTYKGGNVPPGTIGVFVTATGWKFKKEPFYPSEEALFEFLPSLPVSNDYQRNHGSLFDCQRPTVSAVG